MIGLALNSLLYIGNSFADLTEQALKTCSVFLASQRSLHNAPIFRLLLKVAVNGTHQCDFLNFCGAHAPTFLALAIEAELPVPPCVGSVVAVAQALLKMPSSHERCIGP